jgi:prolipoprotein diacylglyceryl transferase
MHPVLFQIGSRPIYAWGVLLMIGFLLATWRAARNAPRYGIAPEDLWDGALFGLLGGIVGGRLVYVALAWDHFATRPAEIVQIWTGGMTSFGGLIGGVLAGLLVARLRKMNVADAADLTAVSLPIGYGIGRFGCFLNGCCHGGRCDLPWAVSFPHGDHGVPTGPVHPAQLYSVLASVIMFAVLVTVEKRRRFRGQLILLFSMMYGVYRFVVEFFREGVTASLSGIAHLTQAQVACLLIVAGAAVLYALLARRHAASAAPGGDAAPAAPSAS